MTCSLAEADPASEYAVEGVAGPAKAELHALGIVPGTSVWLLRRSRGHVLVAVGDSRYALGEEVAGSVTVRRR